MVEKRVRDVYPLTPLQHGIVLDALSSQSDEAYVEQVAGTIEGGFDVRTAQEAWNECVRRHAVLRTAFVLDGISEPRQVVLQEVSAPIRVEDLQALDPAARQRSLEAIAAAERGGLDFGSPPLSRIVVVRLGPGAHHFLWTYHHAVLDAWSISILLAEFSSLYDAMRTGRPLRLPRPPSFREYVDSLGRSDLEDDRRFWRAHLAGIGGGTSVGVRRSAPEADPRWRDETLEITGASAREIAQLARTLRVTHHTLVAAALALTLSRSARASRVTFGVTVSNRPPQSDYVGSGVGLFLVTVPVSVDVPRERGAATWVQELHALLREVQIHSHLPLREIHDAAGLELGQRAIEVLLVNETFGVESPGGSSLTLRGATHTTRPVFPVAVFAGGRESATRLRIVLDASKVDPSCSAGLLAALSAALAAMCADPQRTLASIALHAVDGRAVPSASADAAAPDLEPTIARWERQARATPEAVAYRDETIALTFADAEARAERTAAGLARLGVRREDRVVVLARRTAHLPVAVLGIWKAGAAYAALDADQPVERLRRMVDACRPSCIVSSEADAPKARELAGSGDGAPRVTTLESLAQSELGRPRVDGAMRDLAYVMFTSGSSGTPKGVLVEHRGLANNLACRARSLGIGPEDVVAATASPTFDISMWELFAAPVHGARTQLLDLASKDAEQQVAALQRSGVTILEMVPSVLAALLDSLDADPRGPPALSRLRWLVSAGEALPPGLARRWTARFPQAPILNAYAPTECSDAAAVLRLDGPVEDGGEAVPVGSAVANTTVRVLDAALEPLPAGLVGEIHVGGVTVARGYAGDPRRTASMFVPDPGGTEYGGRLYRTGDRGVLLPSGHVRCLGRWDDQVKVRGHRIELDEIRHALLAHPAVTDAFLDLVTSPGRDPSIVAHVCSGTSPAPAAEELREHLARRLPAYMVPALFAAHPRWPVTSRGKIDRAALRAAVAQLSPGPQAAADHQVESEIVANVWKDVLGVDDFDRARTFFDLGGHSLLLMRLRSRLQTAFERTLPLEALVVDPTVAGMARAVRHSGSPGLAEEEPFRALHADHYRPSFSQRGMWQRTVRTIMPLMIIPSGVRLVGPVDVKLLEESLNEVARRHDSLRAWLDDSSEEPVMRVSQDAVAAPLRYVDLRVWPPRLQDNEIQLWLEIERRTPMDARTPPPWRATLLRVADEEYVFVLTLHHLFADEASMHVMQEEAMSIYAASSSGRRHELAALQLQYGDYAEWQRGSRHGADVARQKQRWMERFAAPLVPLRLTGRIEGAAPSEYSHELVVQWPQGLLQGLLRLAVRESSTSFVTMLAITALLMRAWTGTDDVRIEVVFSGRSRRELDPMVGLFSNVLPLRIACSAELNLRQLIAATRREVIFAQENQDAPGGEVKREIAAAAGIPEADVAVGMVIYQRAIRRHAAGRVRVTAIKKDDSPGPSRVIGGRSDVSFEMMETDDTIQVKIVYNEACYMDAFVTYALDSWLGCLGRALEAPGVPLRELWDALAPTPPPRDASIGASRSVVRSGAAASRQGARPVTSIQNRRHP